MLSKLLLVTLGAVSAASLAAQEEADGPQQEILRVASFNVRYWNKRDGENRWEMRRHRVAGLLRLHRADIFGVQEALAAQMQYLHYELADHDSFGVPRDGDAGGERSSIFWDRTKLDRIGGATFWLSETPDRPSRAWGASLRRICTWCEFRSKHTGKTFFVFNTHFDHQSKKARQNSATLVRQKIHEIAGSQPVVLMGDLNCDGFSEPYQVLAEPNPKSLGAPLLDARVWAEHDYGPQGTWSGWNPAFIGSRIDYVFVKNHVRVLQHAVIPHEWQGRVASDHFPVLVEVELPVMHVPNTRNMAHLWRMVHDVDDKGQGLGLHKPDVDDRKWPTISAGDAWERQGHAGVDGVVYLRKKVHVPEAWREGTVQFVTAGIADYFTLYVNGEQVHQAGSKDASVSAHRINLHLCNSTLRFGAENTFVLRVTDVGGLGGLVGHPLVLTTDRRAPTASAEQFATEVLMAPKDFGIPIDTHRAEFEVTVPAGAARRVWLRVGIDHDCDEEGDKGVHYELHDGEGEVVQRGFTACKGVAWFQHAASRGSKWKVVVVDKDTSVKGQSQANGCNIRVELKVDPISTDRGIR